MNNIQNNFIERKPENVLQLINEYFYGNKEYIELFLRIQNEMLECDPDLLFCKRNSLIGFAKEGEKYRLYIVPIDSCKRQGVNYVLKQFPYESMLSMLPV